MVSSHFNFPASSESSARTREFREIRASSEALAAPLDPEDCVVQTIPEVSPAKWHLAHVTWFFEEFCLCEYLDDYEVFDERFHYLFNSYYYSAGDMHARAKRGLLNRPWLAEVLDYRAHVDEAMIDLIERRGDDREAMFRTLLGLHHEQQHQELLLTDIKHVFFSNPLSPAYSRPESLAPAEAAAAAAELEFIEMGGGLRSIGADAGAGFCFDNETPRHEILVGDHALGNRLVTNAEFRQFVDDGGYREPRFWMADGWSLVLAGEISRPWYWSDDLSREFTLHGWRDIEAQSPVCHLSYYEADAYARWAGARLPLESEWELAAHGTEIGGNLLDDGRLHPAPAESCNRSDAGIHQLWGDVWEWTASPYSAYPRFKPLAGTLGEYNGKFMANQFVVRGGSCATWASHLRPTYRSFFYPRDRWQFLGFRLAKDL